MRKMAALLRMGLAALAGGLFVAYVAPLLQWPRQPNDVFAILFTGVLGAGVGFFAVVAAIFGTFSARKIARLQSTLDHLSRNEADGTLQRAHRIFNKLANSGDLARYAGERFEGSAATSAITTVCNEMELISISIRRGIIDPNLFEQWSRSTVIYAWENAEPFVVALRRRARQPSLYCEFERMARDMRKDTLPYRRLWWLGL